MHGYGLVLALVLAGFVLVVIVEVVNRRLDQWEDEREESRKRILEELRRHKGNA